MTLARRWDVGLACLALAAMVFGAIAPGVSPLLKSTGRALLAETCSATGVGYTAPAKAPPWPELGDCGFCVLQHQSPVVPMADLPAFRADSAIEVARNGGENPIVYQRFLRSSCSPRAPPVVS